MKSIKSTLIGAITLMVASCHPVGERLDDYNGDYRESIINRLETEVTIIAYFLESKNTISVAPSSIYSYVVSSLGDKLLEGNVWVFKAEAVDFIFDEGEVVRLYKNAPTPELSYGKYCRHHRVGGFDFIIDDNLRQLSCNVL